MAEIKHTPPLPAPDPRQDPDTPLPTANAVWLSPRQWAVFLAVCALATAGVPRGWSALEAIDFGTDYRIPYELSEDYWLYGRAAAAVSDDRIPLIGDSVIWGQFVPPEGSLARRLGDTLGEDRFANLGLNGSHPAALSGLLKRHGRALRGRRLIVHFNPLWMSSPRRDLRTDRPARFNHPDLVPQFYPHIPSYDASLAHRIGVAAGHRVAFSGWLKHLRLVYFENQDLPAWTLGNPYRNPFAQIDFAVPRPAPAPTGDPRPWTEAGMEQQHFDWVDAAGSLQWRFFQSSIALLRARGNEVFVFVGPLNRHMMTPESAATYDSVVAELRRWLEENGTPHHFPTTLPSELFADTSHPLQAGYQQWAAEALENDGFRRFLDQP